MWSKRSLLIDVLAVERITRLVTEDEIARPLREAVSKRYPGSRLDYLIGCRACASIWVGLAVGTGRVPETVRLGLAFSSLMLLLDRQDERIGALAAAKARQLRNG